MNCNDKRVLIIIIIMITMKEDGAEGNMADGSPLVFVTCRSIAIGGVLYVF